MENITWLLLLVLFISYFCNDIISKLHQNNYKIKDVRGELISYNEKYFNFFEVKTYKYNRTTPAVNASMNMKIAVKDKIEVVLQTLKFLSNEYRHFPMRFQVNLKKTIDSNAFGMGCVKDCGNIKTIYFEKGITYNTCNIVFDAAYFPPLVPNGKFKFNATWLYLNEEIALLGLFFEIYIPFPYPKN